MSRLDVSFLALEVPREHQHSLEMRYIHNVTHEVRTPLTLIMGYADLLQSGTLGDLEPEQQEALAAILTSGSDLWRLLDRVSALLTTQTHTSVALPLNLPEVASAVVRKHRAAAVQAGLRLDITFESDLPVIVGDLYLVEQALHALIDNAIKFTPQGGQITVEIFRDEKWLCAAVRDTGIGIPSEHLAQIFAPFYQVDASATRRYGGCGLGLTVVQAVADEHHGEIGVVSHPGKGSRFVLKLPVTPPPTSGPRH